ncbi:hypothetical protein BDF19DRAFT_432988 [Syncephalis fuscata]|nr:hypothetical protein BDF19DRAFT_432988 [Syncephalis fuscata]
MSSTGSPDASENAQKKREWTAQADETSKVADSETVASEDVTARPESSRKKIREEDTEVQSETSSPPHSHNSSSSANIAHDVVNSSDGHTESTETATPAAVSQPSSSGGFRFGSSKPMSFGSFAAKKGESPFAAISASTSNSLAAAATTTTTTSITSHSSAKKSDTTKTSVATTVVMAKSSSADEDDNSDSGSEESDAEENTSEEPAGFTVSTLGDESRRKLERAHVEVTTGEENEDKLFEMRGKLFEFEDNSWRERGVGLCHININKEDANNVRLVMRRDRTMQLILNTKLLPGVKPSTKDASIYFKGTNLAGEPRSFAVKVKNADYANDFYNELEQLHQF